MSEITSITSGQLSKLQLQDLLQTNQVDVGNDTIFGVSTRRDPSKTRLTLVISAGGSGKASISEAMHIAEQKLKGEYKNFVKFIMIDSSTNELIPFTTKDQKVIKTLNISSAGAAGRFKHEARSSFFKEIMPEEYPVASLIDDHGAAQDRMTGRIKIYDVSNGEGNDVRLMNMIKNIFISEWNAYANLPVDIILLAGLSGGSGSGSFIDLAVLAKEACPNKNNVKVYGYFMLPDTAEGFSQGSDSKGTLYRNGFAALKELESYNSMLFDPDRKEIFKTSVKGQQIEVSSLNMPIDYPVLISGNYDEAVTMIGETIVNLIADSQGTFDQRAFYSNLGQKRLEALNKPHVSDLGILNKDAFPEDSHLYCGIGYSHASIPEKIIIPNIIGNVCRKLTTVDTSDVHGLDESQEVFCSENKPLTKVQFEKAIRTIFGLEGELHANAFWMKVNGIIESAGRLNDNEFIVTKKDILQGNVQEYIDGFHISDTAIEATTQLEEELKHLYKDFLRNIQTVMEMYGPRAIQYLYEGTGFVHADGTKDDLTEISIRTQLASVERELNNKAFVHGEYPPGIDDSTNLLKIIIEFFTHNDVNTWMSQAYDAAQTDVYCTIAKNLVGGTWKQEYEEKVIKLLINCVRFSDIFDVMTDNYEGAGKVLDAGLQEFSAETGERNGINLCQTEKMYRWVKSKTDAKLASINLKTIKQDLIADFINHQSEWTSTESGVARQRFDLVMSQSCKLGKYATVTDGLHLSVSEYFDEILDGIEDVNQQQTEIHNELVSILDRLRQDSSPSLNLKPSIKPVINENILVPKDLISGTNGQTIAAEFIAILGGQHKFHPSSAVDAIVCYQTSVANPLSGLKDIQLWESGYEANKGDAKNSTCHRVNGEYVTDYTELDALQTDKERGNQYIPENAGSEEKMLAGTGLSWLNYPSINLAAYNGNFTKVAIEGMGQTQESRYRVEVFNKKIEYALRENIIECVKSGDTYEYYINLIPEDWDNLNVANYISDTSSLEKGKFIRGERMFEYLAAQNPGSIHGWRKPVHLKGSNFFEEPFDFSEIIRKEHWKPERIATEHKTYMKRIMRKNIYLYRKLQETLYKYEGIRRSLEVGEEKYKEQYRMDLFGDLFTYGIIFTDKKELVWSVTTSAAGVNKLILEVNPKLKALLKGLNLGLYNDGFYFALAYQMFCVLVDKGELKLEELDELKEEIITNMSVEDFEETQRNNKAKIEKYVKLFAGKYGLAKDPVKAIADAYHLKGIEIRDAEALVKFFWEIENITGIEDIKDSQSSTEDSSVAQSVVVSQENTWDCACGHTGIKENFKFCPVCGIKKPVPTPINVWDCPECSNKGIDDKFKFCPECGAKRPVKAEQERLDWDCPECGNKGIDDKFKFCPECGTKRPVKTEQERLDWDCPKCGQKGITFNFCPECGFKKPQKTIATSWDCPECGNKQIALNFKFCPECGYKK